MDRCTLNPPSDASDARLSEESKRSLGEVDSQLLADTSKLDGQEGVADRFGKEQGDG